MKSQRAAATNRNPQSTGKQAEDYALALLESNGFELVERNFNCRGGELDLIMKQQQELVFVEVRYRRRSDYGDGLESVDRHKQRKLRTAAETWLQRNPAMTFRGCRFAVMAVSGPPDGFESEWVDDAF